MRPFARGLLSLLALALPLAAACVDSDWKVCADGRLCGPDRVCDELNHICSSPDNPCLGAADETTCGGATLVCIGGTCADTCGNGELDQARELCDATGPETPPGMSCLDFGFDAGREGCAGDCQSLTRDSCMHFGWWPDQPFLSEGSIDDLWGTGDDVLALTSSGVRSAAKDWATVGIDGEIIAGRALWASSSTDIWVIDVPGDRFRYWNGSGWNVTPSPVGGLHEILGQLRLQCVRGRRPRGRGPLRRQPLDVAGNTALEERLARRVGRR